MFHIGHNLINRKTEIKMKPLKISLFLFNSNPENLFRPFIQSMHLANFELRFIEETSERRLPGCPGQMFFSTTHALADLVCQNNKKFRL